MEKNILIDEYKMLLFYLTKSHVSSIFLYTILKLFAQHDSNKIYMYNMLYISEKTTYLLSYLV